MKNLALSNKLFTVEEYIEFEETSEIRHEFHEGHLYPMDGTGDAHNEIIQNTVALMRPVFRKLGCKIYSENLKLQIYEKGKYVYPDIILTCDERDKNSTFIKRHPSLIIEVLSKSTASYDKSTKFEWYQELPSVQYYLTVESRWQSAALYSRTEKKNVWTIQSYSEPTEIIEFPKLDFQIIFEDLYEGLGLPKKLLHFRDEDE